MALFNEALALWQAAKYESNKAKVDPSNVFESQNKAYECPMNDPVATQGCILRRRVQASWTRPNLQKPSAADTD